MEKEMPAKQHLTERQSLESNRIGNLNGKWAFAFKALMTLGAFALPALLALNVWFVTSIYEVKIKQAAILTDLRVLTLPGPRYTQAMADHDLLKSRMEIMEDFEKKFVRFETQLQELKATLEKK